MLKEKKTRKKQETSKTNGDGQMGELLAQQGDLLKQILQKVQDHDAQFAELSKNQDLSGRAKLLATDIAYNPDERHLSDMAVIVPRAVEPFALARTLDAVLDDETRSGKKSLTRIYVAEVKHLSRGLRGKGFDLAAQHAREAEVTKTDGIEFEQADMGKAM